MRARVLTLASLAAALAACAFDPPPLPESPPDSGVTLIDSGVSKLDAGQPRDAEAPPVCGDGIPTELEACDDGNDRDGDGCTLDCGVEPGFVCAGTPSFCSNPRPSARDDAVRTREDTAVELDPLANDADSSGDVLRWVATGTPAHGRLERLDGARVRYVPDVDTYGVDRWWYRIEDTAHQVATATISVTVEPVNDAPRARALSARTAFETGIDVALEVEEPDGHSVRVRTTPPAHGALGPVDAATLRVRYTPARGYVGRDAFTYRASDASGLTSATATVSVVVLPHDWRVPDAAYRRALCVDGSTVTEPLIDFPVLLRAGPEVFAGAPSGGALVFQGATGGRYPHELERWSADRGALVWIRVPRVASSTTTCFAAYYGGAAQGPAPEAREVWSGGHASVLHLDAAAHDARRAEAVVWVGSSTVEGVVGAARALDGHAHVDLARGVLDTRAGAVSGWLWLDAALDLSDDALLVYGTRAQSGARQGLDRDEVHVGLDADEHLRFFAWGSGGAVDRAAPSRLATGQWRHFAVTWAADVVLYVDGVERARAANVADPFTSEVATRVGAPFDASVRNLVGRLDEVRTASVSRSASWIRAERASVIDAGFLVIGPPDDGAR